MKISRMERNNPKIPPYSAPSLYGGYGPGKISHTPTYSSDYSGSLSYVSADIDTKTGYALHFSIVRLLSLCDWKLVKVYRTRKGFHISGRLKSPAKSPEHLDSLRAFIGDDWRRIAMDARDRSRPQQILFDVRKCRRRRVDITQEVMADVKCNQGVLP